MNDTQDNLIRLGSLARKLHIPAIWLKEQAARGSLPHVNAGGVLLFNLKAVKNALAKRASKGGVNED